MNAIALDIIIPVKDRGTVLRCVSTLLEQIEAAQGIGLGKILLCDGGSEEASCQQQLHQVSRFQAVEILQRPHPGFNKGWLLNQALAATTASVILISDVDILWPGETLKLLGTAAARRSDCFFCVQSVKETQANTVAVQRPRYTYRVTRSQTESRVEVYTELPTIDRRPGYGLLCGQRALFQRVGGYRHCFQGWGWEDRDLLLRSQLLGVDVAELGTVTHLSHGDDRRNAFTPDSTPQQSRDRNIRRCLQGLAQGKLLGDWPQPDDSGDACCSVDSGSSPPLKIAWQPFDCPIPQS